jgi:hypothetical protein
MTSYFGHCTIGKYSRTPFVLVAKLLGFSSEKSSFQMEEDGRLPTFLLALVLQILSTTILAKITRQQTTQYEEKKLDHFEA